MTLVQNRSGHLAPWPRPRRLRVLLVDDHEILRHGLKALLETDPLVQVVGEAGTVAQALTAIGLLNPSLIITDLGLPGRSGVELITALGERRCDIPILVLTVHNTHEHLCAAMHAGARGFILKDSTHAELLQGLHAVSTGQKFLCETLSKGILQDLTQALNFDDDALPTMHRITRREREVLTRIAMGQSSKDAARELGLSCKTVEKHRSNMMRKLDLHNCAAVTMFALRHGLLSPEGPHAGRAPPGQIGIRPAQTSIDR